MSVSALDAAVVIAARQFNPSVMSPTWLVSIGLIKEGDLEREYAFTPVFAQASTVAFTFLLTPERFQFTPRVAEHQQSDLLLDKVGCLVRAIPHTPYFALGMNFNFRINPEHADVRDLTRAIFFVPSSPLHAEFDSPDARFGGYLSRDVLDCRLKLEVKPALGALPGEEEPKHCIVMNFNFHHEIDSGEHAADQIIRALENWNRARALADRIVRSLVERDIP